MLGRRLSAWVGLILLWLATCSLAQANFLKFIDCEVELKSALAEPKKTRVSLTAGNVTVAIGFPEQGAHTISTVTYPFPLILSNFRLGHSGFVRKFAGKKVLLVGEGFGDLLPELLKIGAQVTAVDPLYGLAQLQPQDWTLSPIADRPNPMQTVSYIRDYFQRLGQHLIPGVAQSLPVKSGWFDYVLSHMTLSNFADPGAIRQAVFESGRVLKRGGQALHVAVCPEPEEVVGPEGFLRAETIPLYFRNRYRISLSDGRRQTQRYNPNNGGYRLLDNMRIRDTIRILQVDYPVSPN